MKRERKKLKQTPKKKLKWEPFEITRIKLNPEQAVLTCCDGLSKSMSDCPSGSQCRQEAPWCECIPAGSGDWNMTS